MRQTIFEIYKDLGIDYEVDLREFIKDDFFFIYKLDPYILDQMTAEEICDSDAFYNCEYANPYYYLMKHNKMTKRGFDHMMSKDNLYIASSNITDHQFYEQCVQYIYDNQIDITEYVSSYLDAGLEVIIEFYRSLDLSKLLAYTDLIKLCEKEAAGAVLFPYRSLDSKELLNQNVWFVLSHYEVLKDRFFTNEKKHTMSPSIYISSSRDTFSYPMDVICEEISPDSIILRNAFLCEEKFNRLVRKKDFDNAQNLLGMFYSTACVSDHDNLVYKRMCQNTEYVRYFTVQQNPTYDGEMNIDIFEHRASLEKYDPKAQEMRRDILVHKKLNENGLYYDFSEHMYYNDYSEELMEFYLDLVLNATDEQRENYRFNNMSFKVFVVLLEMIRSHAWAERLFIKAFDTKEFKERFIDFVKDNGEYEIFLLIAKHFPEAARTSFDFEKLTKKIIHNQYYSKVIGVF